jgi:uncharacterized protein (TIGR03437 family)
MAVKLCLAQSTTWTAVKPMSYVRDGYQQTLLSDGRVLVTGGIPWCPRGCLSSNTAELYDPKTGLWSPAAEMRTPRGGHTASRLQSGNVLVAGGSTARGVLTPDAELYDAASNTWKQTGNLNAPRTGAEAVPLSDGRILVVGGIGPDARTFTSSAEVYDPATGCWSTVPPMSSPRLWHTATLLADGRVLVTGGIDAFNSVTLRTAELFDPATGAWTTAGNMRLARSGHTATLLPNGKVLIAGGPEHAVETELFDPETLAWTPAGNMREGRGSPSATLLPNGRVLVAGGYNLAVTFFDKNLSSSEIYEPATQRWEPGPKLVQGRAEQKATLLKNGKVLVTGGLADWDAEVLINDAEVYGAGALNAGSIAVVSAASFVDNASLAPESVAAAFGRNIAPLKAEAESLPLPTTLAGVSVQVGDAAGISREAPILLVSPEQINFVIPIGTASGPATVTVVHEGNLLAGGTVDITKTAPALFSMDATGDGLPLGEILRIRADGTEARESVGRFDEVLNRFVPIPLDLASPDDQVLLILYATGVRGYSSTSSIRATIGGMRAQIVSVDVLPEFPGVDQVALSIPRALAGRGDVEVAVVVDGLEGNVLRLNIR